LCNPAPLTRIPVTATSPQFPESGGLDGREKLSPFPYFQFQGSLPGDFRDQTLPARRADSLFELSSKDIILFKKHPEAISARNLLRCGVVSLFAAGNRIGVELECGGERLVAEVARQAALELEIREGGELFAAIKASAFRELG